MHFSHSLHQRLVLLQYLLVAFDFLLVLLDVVILDLELLVELVYLGLGHL